MNSATLRAMLVVFAVSGSVSIAGDAPVRRVPTPTGSARVGVVAWRWVDGARLDPRASLPLARRSGMARLWYPASGRTDSTWAPYAPGTTTRDARLSWSVAGAPPREGTRAPLVVLCPGRGVPAVSYSAIAEDLASHGFAVLGIDSPHSGRIVFPDGQRIPPNTAYALPPGMIAGPYERVDDFYAEAAQEGSADIVFLLEQVLAMSDSHPAGYLRGRLDLTRIGAFGHSLGGRICGAAVARRPEFVALVSMEGIPPRAERRAGLTASSLMLIGDGLPEEAMVNLREIVPARGHDAIIAHLAGFTHNAVTDDVVFDSSAVGAQEQSDVAVARTRTAVRGFLEYYLREIKTSQAWAQFLNNPRTTIDVKP